MTHLWLLRHAETAVPDVFHGAESDIGLSARGFRQAEAVASYLAGVNAEVIVSSGMLRARLTAEAIQRACNLPLEIEPMLHERRVGKLVGQQRGGLDGVWGKTFDHWVSGNTAYAPEGAESYDDLRERLVPAWESVLARHRGRRLIVVVHGIVIRVLLLHMLHGGHAKHWAELGSVQNAAISELTETDGRWHALSLNRVPEAVLIAQKEVTP